VQAGAHAVYLVEERCGRDRRRPADHEPGGHVVSTSRGYDEVAVILALRRRPLPVGADGGRRDERGDRSVHPEHYNVLIGERRARRSSWRSGRAALGRRQSIVVKGSDAVARCPRRQDRRGRGARAVHDCIGSIVATIRSSLECTPGIAADMVDSGIVLTAAARCWTGWTRSSARRLPARDDRGRAPVLRRARVGVLLEESACWSASASGLGTWGARNGPHTPKRSERRDEPGAPLYLPTLVAPGEAVARLDLHARAPREAVHPRYSDRLLARAGPRPSGLTRPRQRSFMAPTGSSDALDRVLSTIDFHTAASDAAAHDRPRAPAAPPSRRSAGGSRSTSITSGRALPGASRHRDCSSRS